MLEKENIIYHESEGTKYIQFKRLLEYENINHCYTLKGNDISFKKYGDDDSILQGSYEKISRAVGFKKENIVKPHQTHTDRIEYVSSNEEVFEEVDGLFTNNSEIALCTTSADCTSLLFYDPVKKVIADIHSGWRGTLQRIGQKAVNQMKEKYNCEPENIICCICPCIQKCHFEVDEDVKNLFENEFKIEIESITGNNQIIFKGRNQDGIQKYNIDTTLLNIIMLEEAGLKEENIIDSGICTVCNSDKFHSYRVDKEKSGRNGAIIQIK